MIVIYNVILFLTCVLSSLNKTSGWSHNDERLIRRQILQLSEYDRLTRPEETTVVKVALNLLTINYIDIKTQKLSCTGWLTVIWYPELFIDNSLADVHILNDDNLQCRVTHKGSVFWEIPRIFVTHCEIDITYFPYDSQSCVIEVTSWAYSTKAQILKHLRTQVNTKELVQNGEWTYKFSHLSSKNITEEQVDGTSFSLSQLDFVIVLERRPLHYVTTIILPTVIITYLSVIVFILPTQSGEKSSYTLTVFLALAVLLTFIQDLMPPTALHVSYLCLNKTSEYDRLTRPEETTVVKVALNLLTINYIDIKTQKLSCTGWLTVIWYPELFIDNSLADVHILNDDNLQCRVTHKGSVFWEIPRIFVTHCEIDITYFPYDSQSCVIEVTSWAYSTKAQILKHLRTQVNTKELVQNGEWTYKFSHLSSKNITEEQVDGTSFSLSQLDFVINDVHCIMLPPSFTYSYYYLFVSNCLHPTNTVRRKIQLYVNCILALAVLLTFIQDLMPPTALHVSYLCKYFIMNN
ncbi:LOW QUALITY PROTEIN: hypothetical protein KUTeg_004237 [Tegillarca granosa]|uniref:Uncharacterized protein n=1 Tax=Tegillarca granosa TaxID=220873 RepID=A0ABQ9FPD7_TEGGR|nr:LOW QUALITY PROTEIN: hypothetical protein KUTeg_004237 [Tegillarca granosa]